MSAFALPLAAHILAAAILTLVLPLGVLVAVTIWYYVIWQRDARGR